jgi:dTDP-4-amino-4,6-dideoxygalactose transaminase
MDTGQHLIPFVDLKSQYTALRNEVQAALQDVLEQCTFASGPAVAAFEAAFARYCGVRHCIGVNSGTSALHLALIACGVGPGDEVLTVPMTFVATSWAISYVGARPVFVDIEPTTYTMDVAQVERKITPRTRALLPVHLYGQMADLSPLRELCDQYGLTLIEDAAQAHGAEYHGTRAGGLSQAGCFSFYPGKNLGAYGDAGAILTNDDELALKMRMFANHGALQKHHHVMEGINSRLDSMQAAILSVKLPHIHDWTRARQQVAAWYDAALSDVPGVERPRVRDAAQHVYHLYVIKVDRREELMAALSAKGIETAVHYPVPLPAMEAYKYLAATQRPVPRALENAGRILSLPIYPELSREAVQHVAQAIARRGA